MTGPTVAVFATGEEGHFQRLRPLVADLVRRGAVVHVFTDERFRGHVEEAGARFVDLHRGRPLAAADDSSVPFPCRFVSFAGHFASSVIEEARPLSPALVVYDTFAVIGRVVAGALGVPSVNACGGHGVDPERYVAQAGASVPVAVSPRCEQAVAILRDEYGFADASPFAYVSGLSPYLNVYAEPPQYLTAAQRERLEPLACFGSLPSADEIEARRRRSGAPVFAGDRGARRVYVSFGTVVWRYFTTEAIAALTAVSAWAATAPDVEVVISLGRAEPGTDVERALSRPNVTVHRYVDQWAVLAEADVFVTHHGLNSTHEAVLHGVPMVSYPFFADQPATAAKCQRLGLAVPLVPDVRGSVDASHVGGAVARLAAERAAMAARLAEARQWELDVIAGRPAVIDRVLGLAESTPGSTPGRA